MRLRTLPLSLSGIAMGVFLAAADYRIDALTVIFLVLTTVSLQILTNLSNELGDTLHGTDTEDRQGMHYSLQEGDMTVGEMKRLIAVMVALSCIFGLLMIKFSFGKIFDWHPMTFLILGAAAIWAAMHYTLGKNPYGYRGLGDLFVFLFFGIATVCGGYFLCAHEFASWIILLPAAAIGCFSVAVLNVNNIRDMQSDDGIRKTIPLRIGERGARIYQTALVVLGVACFGWCEENVAFCVLPTAPFFLWHIIGVWRRKGRQLDKMLPLLVITTFVLCFLYGETFYIESTCPYPIW